MPNIGDTEYSSFANVPGLENHRGVQYRICAWNPKNYTVEGLLNVFKESRDNLRIVLTTVVKMKEENILTGPETSGAINKIDSMIVDLEVAKGALEG